ncbi:WD repeat domain-containing protein [Chloropicon primus]|uniref:WD repeat domain-containing protein n=1 Tax=Chloropicon primus TaxID=1764295 RepID=A0A5B8MFG2_9CHLO|nr:WD repeat domain-containing protein [Chloropicon primus]UPQ97264.1 WD repeat domain-containing protein [Chloropicon primus]|eukprot:QDZ18050.1 WD repeat domain-containing protein [Chloropicon primus]
MTISSDVVAGESGRMMSKEWQRPYVNVFKICGVESYKDAIKEGDVKSEMDRSIGRRVIRVAGKIPAVNFLQVPGVKGRSLGLTGRYLYMQIRVDPSAFFTIHLEVSSADRNTTRVSFSNLFKTKPCVATPQTIQIPLQFQESCWKIVAIDLADAMLLSTSSPFHALKSVQLCSSLHVRNLFTSDNFYSWTTLPREMLLFPSKSQIEKNDILWVLKDVSPGASSGAKEKGIPVHQSRDRLPVPVKPRSIKATGRRFSTFQKEKPTKADPQPSNGFFLQSKHFKRNPYLSLDRISAFEGRNPSVLKWVPDKNEVVYAYKSTIISMNTDNMKQRFFFGHDAPIQSLVLSADGDILVSAQEGSVALIRIWDYVTGRCLFMMKEHSHGITSMDLSADGKALAVVGLDAYGKQVIAIWDVSSVRTTGSTNLILKQRTEYDINCLKFSAFEEDHLMTCGVDSIRMYRLRSGKLHGLSVQLGNEIQGNRIPTGLPKGDMTRNIFTDIAFESAYSFSDAETKNVYVSSTSGAVFQINYGKRVLECIYKLHSECINSVVLSEGYCITASDDKFIRVWPTDFSDFYLEVEHDAPVTNMSLSYDGLQIAVGTSNGTIGYLDIPSHEYKTLIRSHSSVINDVAVDPQRKQFSTVSDDGSVRVWHFETCEQLFQFDLPDQKVCCIAYHPQKPVIACGCSDGLVRVFDISKASLIQEHKQHSQDILKVMFHPQGSYMYTGGSEGTICVYDVDQNYMPVRYLTTSVPSGLICMAVSPDGKYFATVGTEASSILIFDGVTLTSYAKIFTTVRLVESIQFSPDSCEIFIVNVDSDVEVYDIETQKIVKHIPPVPNANYGAFNIDLIHNRLVLTGGSDSLIRIWEYVAQDEALLPSQSFAGHVGAIKKIVTTTSEYVISLGEEEGIYTWKFLPSGGLYDDDEGSDEEVIDEAKFYSSQDAQKLPFSHYKSLGMKDRSIPLNCGSSTTTIVGCNSFGKQNMAWIPKEGVICYSIENVVVVEDISTQKKQYLTKHDQAVSCLCSNAEGTLLASGAGYPSKSSKRATIWLWDVKEREAICTYEGPRTGIQKMAFSSCSKYLAAISIYPLTKFFVYNTRSGLLIKKGTCSFMINDLCWSKSVADAAFLAVGKQNVREFSVKDDKVLRISDFKQDEMQNGITSVLYVNGDESFVFGDTSGKLWLKDEGECTILHQLGSEITTMAMEDGELLVGSRRGHLCRLSYLRKEGSWEVTGKAMLNEPVLDISFGSDMSQGVVRLATSGLSHVNLGTGELTPLVDTHKAAIDFILPSEDHKTLVTVDANGSVSLWHTEGSIQKVMEFEGQSPCLSCALSKQGDILVTTTASSAVNIHNLDSNKVDAVTGAALPPQFCHLYEDEASALLLTENCDVYHLDLERRDLALMAGIDREAPWLQASDFRPPGQLVLANSNWIEVYKVEWEAQEVVREHEYPIGNTSSGPAESVHIAFLESKPNSVLYGNTTLNEFLVVDYVSNQAISVVKFTSPLTQFSVSRDRTTALFSTKGSTFVLEASESSGTVAVDSMKLKRHSSNAVRALALGKASRSKIQILYAFGKTLVLY